MVGPLSQALRIYAVLCAGYVASQFYRVSNAVIAPELMRSLSLSAEAMGAITGAYFLAFGVMQIPTGLLLDRFGPRRTMSSLLALAAGGSMLFALADSGAGLTAGRAVMGAGCAAGLMGSMVAISRWFPPGRFAPLSSLLFTIGGAGILLATAPLALAAGAVGWRGAFWGMAVVTLALAAALFAVVRDAPSGREPEGARESLTDTLRGLREVAGNRQLWHVCAIQFVNYGSILAITGLWGGPYLNDVYGLEGVARGNVLFGVNLATLAGVLAYAVIERRIGSRKWTIVGGVGVSTVLLVVLAVEPGIGLWPAVAVLTAFGITASFTMLMHAHARALLPDRLVGRGLTLQNLAVFLGVAAMQALTGLVIGWFSDGPGGAPEIAYRAVFAVLALAKAASLLAYLPVRDVVPGEEA